MPSGEPAPVTSATRPERTPVAGTSGLRAASNDDVRHIPAARPLPATTSAILRDASSIISSPSITAPRIPPASEVCHS